MKDESVNNLLENKGQLSAVAEANFNTWDTQPDGRLDLNELAYVAHNSPEGSSEQAAARILFENFDIARTQSVARDQADLPLNFPTAEATRAYTDLFGGDKDERGVTRKDLAAIDALSSEARLKAIVADTTRAEEESVTGHVLGTVGKPILGILGGIGILAMAKYKPLAPLIGELSILDKLAKPAAVASIYTGYGFGINEGIQAWNSIAHNGSAQLEHDLKARRAMLNSMKVDTSQSV